MIMATTRRRSRPPSSVRANVVRHLSGSRVIIAPTETVAVLPALYVHLLKRKFSMMHEATVSAVPVGAQGQAKNQRTVDATAGVVEITLSIQFHLEEETTTQRSNRD